jgi:hypothetical protein
MAPGTRPKLLYAATILNWSINVQGRRGGENRLCGDYHAA